MKSIAIISFLLLVGTTGFGQRDTTSLFWENGTKKYEHICCYVDTIYLIKSSSDIKTPNITEYIVETFWNKNGLEIEELDFIRLYGSKDINEVRKLTSNKNNISYNDDYLAKKYSNYIKLADNYIFEKDYTKAVKFYNLALDIIPNEEYPIKQLKKLQKLK